MGAGGHGVGNYASAVYRGLLTLVLLAGLAGAGLVGLAWWLLG